MAAPFERSDGSQQETTSPLAQSAHRGSHHLASATTASPPGRRNGEQNARQLESETNHRIYNVITCVPLAAATPRSTCASRRLADRSSIKPQQHSEKLAPNSCLKLRRRRRSRY